MTLLPTLSDLATKCGTDKGPAFHNYTQFYHDLFSPLRHLPITLLEVGVLGGESIRMWSEFFDHPDTRIHGVDIHDRELTGFDPRVQIHIGDGSNPNFIYDLTKITGSLDVFLDDGSHYSQHQKDSLRLFWPHIKTRGLAVIEDCHTSYSYPWTKPDEVSFTHSLLDWIDGVMENGAGHCGVPTETDIEELVIRKSVVVIKKR